MELYNPCTEKKDYAPYAKAWELLRRNQKFRDRVAEIQTELSAIADNTDLPFLERGQELRMKFLMLMAQEKDSIIVSLMDQLFSGMKGSRDIIYSKPTESLDMIWPQMSKEFRLFFPGIVRPTLLLYERDIKDNIQNILSETGVGIEDDNHVSHWGAYFAKQRLRNLMNSHFIFAVPKTLLSAQDRNKISGQIRDILKERVDIHTNTLFQSLFGKNEVWIHFLAYEDAVRAYGTPIEQLTYQEREGLLSESWEKIHGKGRDKEREKRISEFRDDIRKIDDPLSETGLIQQTYPNFSWFQNK